MTKYVAFLRAINVGGKNLIKMDELKKIFKSIGSDDIRTYIQSGNVIFNSKISDENSIIKKIESELHKNLSNDVLVFLRTSEDLKSIIETNPFLKMILNNPIKLYITFLKDELKQKLKLPFLSPKKDVEVVKIKDREIYCIPHEIKGQYGFPNLFIEKEFGVKATTRNWNTIIKVYDLMK
jgi:uncharacterized protein (DUF1697 family)